MDERPIIGFVTVKKVAGSTPKTSNSQNTIQDPYGYASSSAVRLLSNYVSGTLCIIVVNSVPITIVTFCSSVYECSPVCP